MATNPYAAIAIKDEANPYASIAVKDQAAPPQQINTPGDMLSATGKMLGDVATGVGKGALSTISSLDPWMRAHGPAFMTNTKMGFGPPANLQHVKDMATPQNTAQSIGKGAEQVGEFMLPGGAEEKLASLAPRAIRPLARIGTAALGAGTVNKAQGGDFGTGALMGAGGAAVGQGLKAAAPAIAEKALGIRGKFDRAFNKAPGAAALAETSGIRPATIAEQARTRIGGLSNNVKSQANMAGPQPTASLLPARNVIADARTQAILQNAAKTHGQLEEMSNTLGTRFNTGTPIPQDVTPRELLDLRRGFNEEHGRWNPELHEPTVTAGRRAYGALTDEFHRVLPESEPLDKRISNLIPVKNRAQIVALHDNPLQKGLARFGAHTGALTMGGLGAVQGKKEGGIPGAIAGGLTGVLAPELIASPEGQMLLARSMNRAGALRPVIGAAAQLTKRKEDEK